MAAEIQRIGLQDVPPVAAAETQEQEFSFLERLAIKKVNGVALTCFEKIVDWVLTLFSCCCSSYAEKCRPKITDINGAPIEDYTVRKIVTVTANIDPLATFLANRAVHIHYVTLNVHKVLFARQGHMFFGTQYNTDHLVVKDVVDHPGQVRITEYETTGTVKEAIVDMNKEYIKRSRWNMQSWDEPVYVTESVIAELTAADANDLFPAQR